MAADLATLPVTKIEVQICGDAHVRNMGCFAAPDGRLIFDINDFDETVWGPWEWDVKRLATSLILAGREAGNSDRLCQQSVQLLMRSYREAMLRFAKMPRLELARIRIHRLPEGDPVRSVLHKAARATPLQNLEKLTIARRDGSRIFKEAKPFLTRVGDPLSATILRALGSYRDTLAPEQQHVLGFYQPVDIAFKVVGTGSVATHDYVVLHFGNGFQDHLRAFQRQSAGLDQTESGQRQAVERENFADQVAHPPQPLHPDRFTPGAAPTPAVQNSEPASEQGQPADKLNKPESKPAAMPSQPTAPRRNP